MPGEPQAPNGCVLAIGWAVVALAVVMLAVTAGSIVGAGIAALTGP